MKESPVGLLIRRFLFLPYSLGAFTISRTSTVNSIDLRVLPIG